MIDLALLDLTFVQQPTSCVLSSYGIIANYFSQAIPVDAAFFGYCDHFGVAYQTSIQAENNSATHFDNEWRVRNCRGGQVILDLHDNSTIDYFVANRGLFIGQFIINVNAQLAYIGQQLDAYQAFLSVGYNNPGGGFHNIIVGKDQTLNSFFIRDPANANGINGFDDIAQLAQNRQLRDGTLFVVI